MMMINVYYDIGERLKLEGEKENMGVGTKKRGSMKAVVLMATPCPESLHGTMMMFMTISARD